jgi:hypothetical protein
VSRTASRSATTRRWHAFILGVESQDGRTTVAFDATSGEPLWSSPLVDAIGFAGSTVLVRIPRERDGPLPQLAGVHARTGLLLWQSRRWVNVVASCEPWAYAVAELVAINPATGEEQWSAPCSTRDDAVSGVSPGQGFVVAHTETKIVTFMEQPDSPVTISTRGERT